MGNLIMGNERRGEVATQFFRQGIIATQLSRHAIIATQLFRQANYCKAEVVEFFEFRRVPMQPFAQ